MVGPADVDDDLENEVADECGKYGVVEKVVIFEDTLLLLVKIFVLFHDHKMTEAAIAALNNRWFGGRSVRAEMYAEVNNGNRIFIIS